jgi:hypothetical protein
LPWRQAFVIPAKAGIQCLYVFHFPYWLDSRLRGNDGVEGFAGIAECEAEKPAFWKSPKQNCEEQPSQLTTESGFWPSAFVGLHSLGSLWLAKWVQVNAAGGPKNLCADRS